MMGRLQSALYVGVLCLASPASVSAYDDRPLNEEDYFGARMQEHHQGQGLYQEPQRRGGYMLFFGALAGIGVEWFWTGRSIKNFTKLNAKADQEFAEIWSDERQVFIKRLSNPVSMLASRIEDAELQLEQLVAAAEDAGIDMSRSYSTLLGRASDQDREDYEEFRQPDVNGDNVISKAEFNQYIRQYLQMFPETAAIDVPRFEDFDVNRDGLVTFDEWQLYLDTHRQAEYQNELLRGMYDTSAQSQGFQQVTHNLHRAQHGGRY